MEKREKEVIKGMYVTLTKELDTSGYLLSYLFQENVLDEEHMDKIKAKKTPKKKREKLIKILCKRENGLRILIKALYITKSQDYLARELLSRVPWSEEEKKCFEDELQGNITEKQALELQVANLKQKVSALEQERDKLKHKHADVDKERDSKELVPQSTKYSVPSPSKGGSILGKLFKKQNRHQDEASNEEKGCTTPVVHADGMPNITESANNTECAILGMYNDDTHNTATASNTRNETLFSELDFRDIYMMSNILTSENAWPQLGEAFDMDPHTLRAMQNDLPSCRAEVLLYFIKIAYPNLTVPEFLEEICRIGVHEIVRLFDRIM